MKLWKAISLLLYIEKENMTMTMIEDKVEKEIVDKVEKKSNLLKNTHPHLLEEWDYEKNKELGIHVDKITKGSQIHSFWICLVCDSSYSIRTSARTLGQNCPYCAGKKVNHTNCLSTTHPELIELWDFDKNALRPSEITKGSSKKVWWICPKCESSYDCTVANKVYGKACAYCHGKKVNHTNSLASLNPSLASEWHPTKNGRLSPHDVTCYSSKTVAWWLGKCGHEWKTSISNRSAGKDCAICNNQYVLIGFNDMWTTNPELAKQLSSLDDGYKYMQNSNKKVDWKCSCGEILKRTVEKAVYRGTKCRNCTKGASKPEKTMFLVLKQLGQNFISEKTFTWSDGKRYDFYLPEYNMIIEMHGKQHFEGLGFSEMGGRTVIEEQVNDRYKHVMAMHNRIDRYVVIDCRESELEWIKENILSSKLAEIFDLDRVNWEKIKSFILFNKGE